jgi:hypothetical protein
MDENGKSTSDDQIVVEVIGTQLEHFRNIDPPCRGMALPDGILLRHTKSSSTFFYLRSGVDDGKIRTQVFASDSPYDRQKASIGSVITPMFDPKADSEHLKKLENLIREWVDFIDSDHEFDHDFRSFKLDT